jgi:hypothetical protein
MRIHPIHTFPYLFASSFNQDSEELWGQWVCTLKGLSERFPGGGAYLFCTNWLKEARWEPLLVGYFFCFFLDFNPLWWFRRRKKENGSLLLIWMVCSQVFFLPMLSYRKGTVAWDFHCLAFIINRPHLGLFFVSRLFSNSVLNSLSYSNLKIVMRCGPLRKTKFFL